MLEAGPRSSSHDPYSWEFFISSQTQKSIGIIPLSQRKAAATGVFIGPGRVLGGSSSINGMLYVRGNPADYDGWAQMGCRGWSFDEVLPYLRNLKIIKMVAMKRFDHKVTFRS